jgi:cephalosporin hydroxylase
MDLSPYSAHSQRKNRVDFKTEVEKRLEENAQNSSLQDEAQAFLRKSVVPKYSYNFTWMGRPIIQYPQDIVAMQEIIWATKPDLILETGVAHGGSLIFSASMLELNALSGGPMNAEVLGIDIDIRSHNREAIEKHPMFRRISMIEGSSIAQETIDKVKFKAVGKQRILVCLDSNHTHEHVLAELEAYAPLVSIGSYCVVFDTLIEDMPDGTYSDRPWGPGNNPKTAVWKYLKDHPEFEIERRIDHKLMISVAPEGYLKRIN